ncbi:hypothetical protein SAY86_018076 [Trapa natans]|uniref:DNA-directed RNA polymerase subunit n=2 Tax=Trapa TaxID=22665 RepID=A0AAN7R2S5_TRANT|nr:hypothetical protein SAY86_018076 [Trapa natans]
MNLSRGLNVADSFMISLKPEGEKEKKKISAQLAELIGHNFATAQNLPSLLHPLLPRTPRTAPLSSTLSNSADGGDFVSSRLGILPASLLSLAAIAPSPPQQLSLHCAYLIILIEEEPNMFFHITLERNMQLHPRHFGRNLKENLVTKLMKDVEGTCSGRHGFVVAITGIENVGKGLIRDGTGFVTFPVKYQCVVFRPFKGQILEAVVTMVNKMGFFAEAGPVQIFVSNHLIPDDMEFQSGDMPNYTTSDGSVKIQKDSEVRLKLIGTRVDATEIFCIGTIKDDFLGVINDPTTS